jgi:DNA-binding GntR family transcriptional regulator
MSKLSVHEQEKPFSRGALRHELVKRLLAEIFDGRMPAGTRLIILNLAKRFGLSSTPVREALLELETNGMVQFIHNRGAVVKPFGPEQLREIFELRRILETEATRMACGRIDPAALSELQRNLRDLIEQPRAKEWLDMGMIADRKLHAMIGANCGNVRLAEEIRRCDALVQVLRDTVGNDRRAANRAVEEHLAIVDALAAGDADAAARAMGIHIERAAQSASAVLFGKR